MRGQASVPGDVAVRQADRRAAVPRADDVLRLWKITPGVASVPVRHMLKDRGGDMSRRLFRCLNPVCPAPHGAVLGRLTSEGGLVLTRQVGQARIYLDTRRVVVVCPHCGKERDFRGNAVFLS